MRKCGKWWKNEKGFQLTNTRSHNTLEGAQKERYNGFKIRDHHPDSNAQQDHGGHGTCIDSRHPRPNHWRHACQRDQTPGGNVMKKKTKSPQELLAEEQMKGEYKEGLIVGKMVGEMGNEWEMWEMGNGGNEEMEEMSGNGVSHHFTLLFSQVRFQIEDNRCHYKISAHEHLPRSEHDTCIHQHQLVRVLAYSSTIL